MPENKWGNWGYFTLFLWSYNPTIPYFFPILTGQKKPSNPVISAARQIDYGRSHDLCFMSFLKSWTVCFWMFFCVCVFLFFFYDHHILICFYLCFWNMLLSVFVLAFFVDPYYIFVLVCMICVWRYHPPRVPNQPTQTTNYKHWSGKHRGVGYHFGDYNLPLILFNGSYLLSNY